MYKAKHAKKFKFPSNTLMIISIILLTVTTFSFTFGKYVFNHSEIFRLGGNAYSEYVLESGLTLNGEINTVANRAGVANGKKGITNVIFDTFDNGTENYASILNVSDASAGEHVGETKNDRIYLFVKDTTAYILSDNEKTIYANSSSDHIFYGCEELINVEFINFNTMLERYISKNKRYVFTELFKNCKALTTIDFGEYDIDFSYASHFDGMFEGCTNITSITFPAAAEDNGSINITSNSNGEPSEATKNMYQYLATTNIMFENCSNLKNVDLSIFDDCIRLQVTSGMFHGCTSLETVDINPNTKVKHMDLMFSLCRKLTEINISNINLSNVTWMMGTFSDCASLEKILINDSYAKNVGNSDNDSEATKVQDYDSDETATVMVYRNSTERLFANCIKLKTFTSDSAIYEAGTAYFDVGVFDQTYYTPSAKDMFRRCGSVQAFVNMDLFEAGTALENTKNMFLNCNNAALTEINLQGLVATSVTDMSNMFEGCTYLKKILLSATDFTSAASTDTSAMFKNCQALATFTSDSAAYTNNTPSFNMSFFSNAEKVTSMKEMFYHCASIQDFIGMSSMVTSTALTDTSGMFCGCNNASLTTIDLTNIVTSEVTDMSEMFKDCVNVTFIKASNNFETQKVKSMRAMFQNCKGITNFNSASVTGFQSAYMHTDSVEDFSHMFDGCSGINSLINLAYFSTANATDTSYMFNGCSSLPHILFPATFTTEKVTDMTCMFKNCSSLGTSSNPSYEGILDISSFNTGNVTSMEQMFDYCENLVTIKINTATFTTSNVTSFGYMLRNCRKLTSFDSTATQVINMSNFDTRNVTRMNIMFFLCDSAKVINISGFTTAKVTTFEGMFNQCGALETIYANTFDTTSCVNSAAMFTVSCLKLQGGAGTKFANVTAPYDVTYARVDGGPDSETPGFFTAP